jgi:hypothetical protein
VRGGVRVDLLRRLPLPVARLATDEVLSGLAADAAIIRLRTNLLRHFTTYRWLSAGRITCPRTQRAISRRASGAVVGAATSLARTSAGTFDFEF